VVSIRVTPGAHACGSTTSTLRSLVEDSIYEAAPDIAGLTVEGLDGKPATGFVPLDKLSGNHVASPNVPESVGRATAVNYGD
jgi:hypothetical protein